MNSIENVHNDKRVVALRNVDGSPLQQPYKSYYKFVFFRHPFTRMVSAWRNKLQLVKGHINKYFYKNFGIDIIRLTRGKAGLAQFYKDQNGNLVTFKEFITGIRHGIVDRHWMPQTEICLPCQVDYEFVGFLEHVNNDTNYVLNQVRYREGEGRAAGILNLVII